jgi:hypothetical protein
MSPVIPGGLLFSRHRFCFTGHLKIEKGQEKSKSRILITNLDALSVGWLNSSSTNLTNKGNRQCTLKRF